jgi:hypothetical protein
VAEYLVEGYVSRRDAADVAVGAERARREAERMSSKDVRVRLVRSIFVPEDETCFYLYEADSVDAVLEAARRADIRVDRIAETFAGQATNVCRHGVPTEPFTE